MKIIQILSTLKYGDGVGNTALYLKNILEDMDFRTEIYAGSVDNRSRKKAKTLDQLKITEEDVILYHMCSGVNLNLSVLNYPCKKVMIYHNITPPEFYKNYSWDSYNNCRQGYADLKKMNHKFDAIIALSEFSKQCLIDNGYTDKIHMASCIIDLNYESKEKYINTDGTKLLYVGRMVPHKKIEDVVAGFAYYKKYFNPYAELCLIGSKGPSAYMNKLNAYIDKLQTEGIHMCGHVSDEQLKEQYRLSDVYISMSEYEGFCIPVIEAMSYQLPVIAYDAAAVKDTVGNGGLLLRTKKPLEIAGAIDYVVQNENFRKQLIENQKAELKKHSYAEVAKIFEKIIEEIVAS